MVNITVSPDIIVYRTVILNISCAFTQRPRNHASPVNDSDVSGETDVPNKLLTIHPNRDVIFATFLGASSLATKVISERTL